MLYGYRVIQCDQPAEKFDLIHPLMELNLNFCLPYFVLPVRSYRRESHISSFCSTVACNGDFSAARFQIIVLQLGFSVRWH